MNIIELIRAQGSRAPEPVIPGESIVLEPGDRIRCEPPFTEVTSIIKNGNDLSLVMSGLTPIQLKEFFSSTSSQRETMISFQDQEFTASKLNKLLTINIGFTNAEGVNSQLHLLPGSVVNAHAGQIFTVNAESVAVKDLHRDGYDLILNSHDDSAKIIATLQGFFIAPEEGQKYPELQITDPAKGTAFDKMIHPHDPIFQWQGEPLPQAVVGAMYAYYFHLDAEDADKMILTAKTTEGALPSWLTFAHLGKGSYMLSGLPNADAVGTHGISIVAQSTSSGVGVHTQQAFHLLVKPASDAAQRSAADDVAAAEFRKAGEIIAADSYGGGLLTIDQMPYMTMPEIASIVGLAALGQIAFKQPFSSEFTSNEIAIENDAGRQSQGAQSYLDLTDVRSSGIGYGIDFIEPDVAPKIVPIANVQQTTNLISTGGLSEVESPQHSERVEAPISTEESFFLQSQAPSAELIQPQISFISSGLNGAQTLLPFLSVTPPNSLLPSSVKISDLNGQNGFTENSTPSQNFYVYHANIIPDVNGDGFADLFSSSFSYVSLISGQTTPFPATFDLTTPGVTSSLFTSGISFIKEILGTGDFNGDGINDFLVVAYGHLSYVVFGDNSGFPASTSFSTLAASGDAIEITIPFFNTTGTNLGDMNGDGLADVAFGTGVGGNAYVLFGTSTPPTSINLSTLSGTDGFKIIDSGALNSTMGMRFVDINSDGFNDLVFKTRTAVQEEVHVVFGHAGGFPATVDVSTLPVGDGFTIIDSSLSAYRALGKFITNIGDVNHDGRDDLMIVEQFTGKAFVIFGDPSFTSTTTFDVATLDGTNGFTITHSSYVYINQPGYLGDINGDGIADIAISEFTSYDGAGAVHIIFGSENPFSATVDMFQSDPHIGFTIIGTDPYNSLGASSGGGDLNGDGLNDIVVTNYGFSDIQAAHVIFGSNFSGIITHMGTSGTDTMTGTNGDDVMYGGAGNDTIDGQDGNDYINGGVGANIINGAGGNDTIIYSAANTSVDGGTETDTLWFQNDGVLADLRGSTVFSGIDVIDLHAMQSLTGNHITLDATEVTAMSDSNAITVNGGGHDSVALEGIMGVDWVSSTPIAGYTTWTSTLNSAVVNVQDTMQPVSFI